MACPLDVPPEALGALEEEEEAPGLAAGPRANGPEAVASCG